MRKYFKLKDKEKQEIPQQKGYKAKLIEDKLNGIGFYILEKTEKTIEKENLENELKTTNEKIIECFEWFMEKMTNYSTITDLPKLFDHKDFPHDLKDVLGKRKEMRNKIKSLEESEE